MKKIFIIMLVCACVCATASAQRVTGTVKGVITDSVSKTPLGDATVSIMRLSDSSLISFTLTNNNGYFEIKNLDAGDYLLVSSYQGLQTARKKFSVTGTKQVVDMYTIPMSRHYKALEEVVIKDDAPVKVKGDTIAYNADAFKTKPNATAEDLLKKLPGVQVDRDGTVKAQGEQVQKVYVDGKEFFGNDPKLATKNLSADMIDQVEIFDDMSEQAKFNKIDDGSRSKAINLKLKKDKKKGLFGKAYAGYGSDERHDVGLNANLFRGAMQTTVIAKTNNTNNIGFTVSDMLGMFSNGSAMGGMSGGMGGMAMGGGGMNIVRMGGSAGASFGGLNLGSSGNGLTSSTQIGFNYRDTWSPKFDITGSYFYNRAETRNEQTSYRQTFGNDTIFINDQHRNSLSTNNNHRINMNLTYKVDSLNSLLYYPSISFQDSRSRSQDTTAYSAITAMDQKLLNQSRQLQNNTGDGMNWNNNLIWRKRFARAGRTLSVNLANTMSNSDRDNYTDFYSTDDTLNTHTITDGNTRNYSAGVSYTEPISRNKIMELNYTYSKNNSESDKEALNYNPNTGKYEGVNSELTNHFKNINESHRAGANFRLVEKKYNYQLGFSVLKTDLVSDNLSKSERLTQEFLNFFPTASFNYQFQRSRSLRFNYRGSTRQPSITQLQEVVDNSNVPYLYKGNAALKQEFSNNFTLSYNYFDIVKFRNLFTFINVSNTYNRISNAITVANNGIQLTQPTNLDGYITASGNFNIGFPIKKLKGGNFNVTSRIAYTRDPSLYNNVKFFTRNLNIGEDLRLNYNFKEKLDMGITASVNYNNVDYSNPNNQSQDQSYFTHTYSADFSYTAPKNFILSTDLDYTFNTGRTDGYNQNFALWNASLAKQVFKNKRGEIKFSVNDLLNQNISVNRNTGTNYIEDVRNLTLRRYFMMTLTYNINRMGGKMLPGFIERATKGIRIN